ncbi:MAG: DUF423 domain-containing protein [Methylococcus sp.]|nr:DUF423 domain-containing protein [Methylococcus sp.]
MSRVSGYWIAIAGIAGATGVAMGAFGAHGLKASLAPEMMAVYQTAVQYHIWHGLGIGLVAAFMERRVEARLLNWAAGLMAAGIVVFSGSLYLLAITGAHWWGMITPFGGVAFLGAWICVAVHGFRSAKAGGL